MGNVMISEVEMNEIRHIYAKANNLFFGTEKWDEAKFNNWLYENRDKIYRYLNIRSGAARRANEEFHSEMAKLAYYERN